MQTTGLFSSSSPQQANVGGGSSLIGTLGAALVLVFGVVLLTGLSLDRTQTAMVRFLAEKGVALVTALESGVRSGTRSRTGIRLQYLVEELADRPDVRFIAVTMPDGGELFLSLHPEPDALRLEIRDTGVGIAPDALPHIFDPYFTTKGQGTGLGLATVHKIMEAHGGSISVTSEPGQGAVFRLLLPLGGEGGKVHGHE